MRTGGFVTYRIWRLDRKPGRCKYCQAPIVWALTHEGRRIPLNAHERPLRQEKHPVTQVSFDVFAGTASHLWTCTEKSRAPRTPKAEPAPFCVCTHRRLDHVDGRGACYHDSRQCDCRAFRPAQRVARPDSLF